MVAGKSIRVMWQDFDRAEGVEGRGERKGWKEGVEGRSGRMEWKEGVEGVEERKGQKEGAEARQDGRKAGRKEV